MSVKLRGVIEILFTRSAASSKSSISVHPPKSEGMLRNKSGEDGLEYGAVSAGGVVAVHPLGVSGISSSKTT
jgi:hypothetical protein